MSASSGERDQTIDVFRGLAILMVVLYHFTARLPAAAMNVSGQPALPVSFGWVGVYVFFAISGYCIYLTLERSPTVALFLARRFSRIYPAFLAAAVFLFAYGLIAPVPSVPAADFHAHAPTLLDLATNLLFVGEGRWVNGSFWSIAVEIKFYAGLALLAAIVRDRSKLATVFATISVAAAPLWIVAMAVSLGGGARLPQELIGLVTIAPYLPFFAIGILARTLRPSSPVQLILLALSFIEGAAVIFMMALDLSPDIAAAWTATLVTMTPLAVLVGFGKGLRIPQIPVLSRGLAALGVVSFSWYLIHENLGASFLFSLNRVMPNWLAVVLTIGATLVIAWVFSELVEWRFRKRFEGLALRALNGIAGLFAGGRSGRLVVSGAASHTQTRQLRAWDMSPDGPALRGFAPPPRYLRSNRGRS